MKTVAKIPIAIGLCVFSAVLATVVPLSSATAQDHGHFGFHGRDVHHFGRGELRLWRGGLWRHEIHNGRPGWWWVVGSTWYFYDRPVYPYPVVVSDLAFAEPVVVAPPAVIAPPPAVVVTPAVPAQPQMWYYCDNPAGYYPYVPTCTTPFRPVPATPH